MQSPLPHQCDIQELSQKLKAGNPPLILDVREKWETDICKIQETLHIHLGTLPQQLEQLPEAGEIVVYCHHGVRSLQAAALIRLNRNPNALSLRGGIHAWAQQIDTSMKTY